MAKSDLSNDSGLEALPNFPIFDLGLSSQLPLGESNMSQLNDPERRPLADAPATVPVGILHSLSGIQSAQGSALVAATLMAIAEINDNGGVLGYTIEPRLEDGTSDLQTFQRATRQLLAQGGIKTIFGGTTPSTRLSIIPLLEEYHALLWYPGATEGLETNSQIFYTNTCANQRLEPTLKWLHQSDKKRPYLIGTENNLEQTLYHLLRWQIRQQGLEIAGEKLLTSGLTEWVSLRNDLQQSQPDLIITTLDHKFSEFYQQYCQDNLGHIPLLCLLKDNLELENQESVDSYFLAPIQPNSLVAEESFLAKFQQRYQQKVSNWGGVIAAYTSVYLWKNAVELAESWQTDRVREAAIGQRFKAPQGWVQIESNQYLSQPIGLYRATSSGAKELIFHQMVKPLPWWGERELKTIFDRELEITRVQLQREILERQQIEIALQDYGAELRAIFSTLSDLVLVTDREGCCLRIAPTQPIDQLVPNLIGQNIYDIVPIEQRSQFLEYSHQALATQTTITFESRISTEIAIRLLATEITGDWVWFAVSLAPVNKETLIWVIRDVTQQKQAELEREQTLATLEQQFLERSAALVAVNDELVAEVVRHQQSEIALQNAKNQLEAVLDAVPGIVSWISSDLHYLGVNRHLANMFNLKPADFTGKHIGFLGGSSEFIDFIRAFFASDVNDDFREIRNFVGGKPRSYLIVTQKYDNGKGAFVVGIDITELHQALESLARSKDQLQAVLDAVPGIVSWINSDLQYMGVNRQLADTFGLKPKDFVGKDLGFLRASEDFNQFVHELFAGSKDDSFREVETVVNGEIRNYLIAAQKYDNGRAAFTVGIDITERQRALQALTRTKDQLQAILAAVPGIVSWIGSDLRYLGVNRHLAETFKIPIESFVGQDIGFLKASTKFNDFVRSFFEQDIQDDFIEVEAIVDNEPRNYLVAAQKYDEGRAAFTVGIDITERHQALEALKEAEAKYRTIFENATEGIFQTTADGRYLSANPALARIYGYASPEELKTNLTDLNKQLYVDRSRRNEFSYLLNQRGMVVGFESQIYRRDGQIRWISENARSVYDAQGNLLYYEGTVEDISERKQAEERLKQLNEELETRVQERTMELQDLNLQLIMEIGERQRIESALRTSEAELKALFAAMTDVITVFDSDGHYSKIVTTNSELVYSPKPELVGKTVYEVFESRLADVFLENIQSALSSETTVNVEYCVQPSDLKNPAPNQEEVWFAASVSPLPNNSVIWVARNITERRRVLEALQKAEEKYRSIFENAAEGIFQTTREGRYISANPALVKMYGYESFEEMAHSVTNIDTQLYVQPGLRQVWRDVLERRGSLTNFQVQVRRKDETLIWTSENARVVRDEQGNILYYEGTVADITKRKEAEDALHLEQAKSERLLLNILPYSIAERLKEDEQAIAERFDDVTILFADIVGFTSLSARMAPTKLVKRLNSIFSAFDRLAEKYRLEKIKTIGDAYMVAGGLPSPQEDHAEAIADMALEMLEEISHFRQDDGGPFQLRIGINTGPVVAGVIGIKKFIYDLWGDTVNIASRMETQGEIDSIQVTDQTYHRLKDKYHLDKRGEILVKGRGYMTTYWLRGSK